MTRAQIAYKVADIVDWELQKERRARAKVNKLKPMTREQSRILPLDTPEFIQGRKAAYPPFLLTYLLNSSIINLERQVI